MFKNKFFLITGVSIILIIAAFCAYKVHTLSFERKEVKQDYSVVNNISFGLLSVNQWRDQIIVAVTHQIEDFDLTDAQKAEIKKQVEGILHALVKKAVAQINKPTKTLGGAIKKIAFKALVDTSDINKQIPVFADQIIAQIEKPSNKEKLKGIAEDKLQDLGAETYDSASRAEAFITDSIYKKYQVVDDSAFQQKATYLLHTLKRETYNYSFGMLGAVVIILLLWWLLWNKPELHVPLFVMSIISALILLLIGLSSTMIELDARIKSIDFKLVGADISFKNQVLFYQSKSILDVVRLLIDTGKIDMVIVGVLILCFSVFFPFAKLISACIHLLSNKKIADNKLIHFFAFKSGKWSMADVMVVAIMMTYIGFNGVVSSQLASLNIHDETITSITTNNTSLQPGYIVFVGFVIYGLILSQILKHITKSKVEVE